MTVFHCSRCSYTSKTLKAMGEHCRKKHPSAMKRKTKARKSQRSQTKYCPECGQPI